MESTGSTNDELSSLINRGEGGGDISLRTDYQESGRGQSGREWCSEKGRNLIISFLLHPAFLSASSQFYLSKMAALALCDLLRSLGLVTKVNWTNDILLNKKKGAGILIEHRINGKELKHTIIGTGLNVNQVEFPDFPRPATSILLEGKAGLEPSKLAPVLEARILERYGQLQSGNLGKIDSDYLYSLYGRDLHMNFHAEGKDFRGIIRGVDELGHLLLEVEGRMTSRDMQDIRFLD